MNTNKMKNKIDQLRGIVSKTKETAELKNGNVDSNLNKIVALCIDLQRGLRSLEIEVEK